MAALYFDSDVSARLALGLGANGHDAVTAHDRGLRRATDDQQLVTAVQESRILVTHNLKDFVLPHDARLRWPAAFSVNDWPEHPGILVLEQRLDAELLPVLTAALTRTSQSAFGNELRWWRASGGWSTRLTGGDWAPIA